MRNGLAGILVLLLGASIIAADSPVSEVESAIRALNETFKRGDATKIKSLVAAEHLAFTPWAGKQTREEQIQTLPDLKLTEYDAGPMTITMLGRDGALITYSLKMKGTYKGQEVPSRSLVSAVWIRKDGKWLELHYQETAVRGK